MEIKWRKDHEIVRIAGKVVDELRWRGAPELKVEQFVRMVKQHQYSVDKQLGGISYIPALDDTIAELRIKE